MLVNLTFYGMQSYPRTDGTVSIYSGVATGNIAGQDGDTLAREVRNRKGDTLVC